MPNAKCPMLNAEYHLQFSVLLYAFSLLRLTLNRKLKKAPN